MTIRNRPAGACWRQLSLAVIMATALLTDATAFAEPAFDPNKPVALPAWRLVYENVNPMIKMAPAWGDRATGAHGTFGRFPPNFITPAHTHTAAYHGIVLEGVMTNPFGDEANPPKMGPGSYWYVPAEIVHRTACISDTPCKFFFTSEAAFDFKPVK